MEMEKYTPNRAHFFMPKKYTTFSTEQIVALRSVNNISLESYDFAASFVFSISIKIYICNFSVHSIPQAPNSDYEYEYTPPFLAHLI
jgi:hypothetical protein